MFVNKFYEWLSFKIPLKLVEKCFIRVATYSSTNVHSDKEFGEITIQEAFEVWFRDFMKEKK